MPGPALLVDTYSVLFRAHHALPPMSTTRGEPTAALYGFSALLLKLLREQAPSGLAFALDTPEPTFRKQRFLAYKAQRERVPDVLGPQIDKLEALIDAFGVPAFRSAGFEADDVLATLARRFRERGQPALVVSGDRDMLQTALAPVEVLFIGRRGKPALRYDESAVRERFGVGPAELPAYVALVGDTSDNLPGVRGVGPRTAAALVRRYGSVARLLHELETVEPARLRRGLEEHAEQLALCEELARLCDDVPLAEHDSDVLPVSESAWSRVATLFGELEFKSLLARIPAQRSA
jgi:DNA polymerase-1